MKEAKVFFLNKDVRQSFLNLEKTDERLFRFIKRAIKDIEKDYTIGSKIPFNRVRKEFIYKCGLNESRNLWKYDLPSAWRLLYTIVPDGRIEILAVILEWCDHKDYEKKIYK